MAVPVDRGSMLKIARQRGEQGKPLPAAMAGDPEYQAAYNEGAGITPPPAPTKPPVKKTPTPAARKLPPGDTSRRQKKSKGPGYLSRAFSPKAAAQKSGAAGAVQSVASAGDGGGLLLALVVYPIILATFKYGATGPKIWFKAKWLNQATGQTTPATAATSATLPSSAAHQVAVVPVKVPGPGHRGDPAIAGN